MRIPSVLLDFDSHKRIPHLLVPQTTNYDRIVTCELPRVVFLNFDLHSHIPAYFKMAELLAHKKPLLDIIDTLLQRLM
jgi:hypothetical protein